MNEKEVQLIGQLQEAAAAGKAKAFRTTVLALMEAYNRAPDEELFSLLHDLLYVPNADAMRANYERARTTLFDRAVRLSEVGASPQEFPAYEELPCRLFPIDADASVFFLNDGKCFLLHESGARLLDAVQKMLLDAPEYELLPLMADALREQRTNALRRQLFSWLEQRSFPPSAEAALAEFAALSDDASAPLHIEAALRFAAGDLTGARELAEHAYALRVANIDLWRLLVDIYDAAGEEKRAARFKGLAASSRRSGSAAGVLHGQAHAGSRALLRGGRMVRGGRAADAAALFGRRFPHAVLRTGQRSVVRTLQHGRLFPCMEHALGMLGAYRLPEY